MEPSRPGLTKGALAATQTLKAARVLVSSRKERCVHLAKTASVLFVRISQQRKSAVRRLQTDQTEEMGHFRWPVWHGDHGRYRVG